MYSRYLKEIKNLKEAILLDLQYYYSQDIQVLLDIAAFLDTRFKGLDPFVAVADRVDIEEAVKLIILELAEEVAEADNNVGKTVLSMVETSNDQDQESFCSEIVLSAKKRKGTVSSLFSELSKAKKQNYTQ